MRFLQQFVFVIAISLLINCFQYLFADFVTIANFGSKWGDPTHGTASDVITWSFMNENTMLAATHPLIGEVQGGATAGSNVSSLRTSFDAIYGNGSFNSAVQNAFNTWSNVSGGRVTFQQVTDNGAIGGDSNNAASSAIDIRIGAFHAVAGSGFSFVGAVGYGPPGNDLNSFFRDALAGDIIINLDSMFIRAAGNEGDIFYTTGDVYRNDLEGLILHELGHAAIGLAHSNNLNVPGLGDVMYVDDFPNCCNFINRIPSAQDIAGLQSVYGITAVPEPGSFVTGSVLALALGCVMYRKRHRNSHS